MADHFLYVKDGAVTTITFNRPERRNCMNPHVMSELEDLLRNVRNDSEVRVLIVTGTGAAFSAVDPGTRHLILQQQLPLPGLGYTAFSDALKAIIAEQDRLSDELVPQLASVATSTLDGSSAAAGAGIRV